VDQGFLSDSDELERYIQTSKEPGRPRNNTSKVAKEPIRIDITKKKWWRGLCISILIFFL